MSEIVIAVLVGLIFGAIGGAIGTIVFHIAKYGLREALEDFGLTKDDK